MAGDVSAACLGVLDLAGEAFGETGESHHILDTPENRAFIGRVVAAEGDMIEGDEVEFGSQGISVPDWILLDYLTQGIREGRIAIIEKD